MIASNSRVRKGGKEKGECRRTSGEEEWNADHKVMVQPSQQHAAPCVKVVEWGLGTRSLGMLAAFWVGILVEVTQEASVVKSL